MRNRRHHLNILFVLTAVLIFSMGTGASVASACGSKPWHIVNSPNASSTSTNSLLAVTAISTNNVWAVGYPAEHGVLIEHWNGKQRAISSSPNPPSPSDSSLNNVAASSSRDVWAVGTRLDLAHNSYQTLALHWDGAGWKIVPSPNVTPADSFLNGVTVLSARDAWAVGIAGEVRTDTALTLIEHWDGHSWKIVASPNVGMGNDILWAVARIPGTHNAWAVGSHSGPTYQTLTEYNG